MAVTAPEFEEAASGPRYVRRPVGGCGHPGAAFRTRSELEAHAWLRCGSYYVTGGSGQQRFGTLGIFG